MATSTALNAYMPPLLAGNRTACRDILCSEMERVSDTRSLYFDFLWPAMERVEKLYRADRINVAAESMATRINRSLSDHLQTGLARKPSNGKRLLITSAPFESEEMGAQMCADLFEANGWDVYLLGGGIPNDEILSLAGQLRPDILLIFGTTPSGVPAVRQLVDLIREIGVNPTMNIMVAGGVYNRADGLWKEVNADLFAKTAKEAMPMADAAQPRKPEPPRIGPPKKRRRRRRPPLLAAAEASE